MQNKFKIMQKRKNFLILLASLIIFLGAITVSVIESFEIPIWKNIFNACAVKEFSSCADDYPMSVHVLDVGKADAIFITCEGKNILIDAGETSLYKFVNEYLRKMNVKTIDQLILSHQHSDHVGAMSYIVDEFDIKSFMMPQLKDDMIPTFRSYERLLTSLDNKGMKAERPEPGKSYDIGQMKIDVFAPILQYDDMNNNSIVVKITYKNRSFLFTGDAGSESEKDMIAANFDLKADVLKIGHHGSKTATSQAFLNKVQPLYAMISVGEDRNKLPKKEIINRLKKNNIQTYRTDLDGTVIFATDGDNLKIFCEKEKK